MTEADRISTWYFYDVATGLFTGASFTGTVALMSSQLEHLGPAIGAHEGSVDPLSQRKDLVNGALVDYKPDPPWDGTDLTLYVWKWHSDIKRWRIQPRLKKLKDDKWAEIKAARDAAMDEPLVAEWGTFDHDAKSRQALFEVATGASVTSSSVVFTLADDTEVKLDPKQIATVLAMSHTRVQLLREQASELRTLIYGVGSASDLGDIQWLA